MATGIFSTASIALTTDLQKKSFAALITRLMPNGSAPLFGMTSMLKTETAVAPEHGFFTKTMLFPSVTTSASYVSTDTTIAVTSTANIVPGMILRVEATGENIIVNTVPSSTSIVVARGVGNVAAGNIGSGVILMQIGSAYEEGSLRPNAVNLTAVRVTNLTQIFRNSWAVTDTARATMTIAGDTNVAESKQDCVGFHAADIEKALFFGQQSSGTRNGQPFRTMDGLISIVGNAAYYPPAFPTPNVFTAGSTTNWTQLEGFLDVVFNQATDPKVASERVLFVGGTARKVINNIGRLNGTYQLVDGMTNYGLQFSTLKSTRGTFRIIEHPLFNASATWAKMAVAVDLTSFNLAYLADRKTKSEEDFDDNGIDAVGGSLTTELTCIVKNPPANSIIYNLTAAAAG